MNIIGELLRALVDFVVAREILPRATTNGSKISRLRR